MATGGHWTLGVQHERMFAEIPARDPGWADRPATATVYVECNTENGEVTAPSRVVITLAAGSQGAYPGSENTQGWSGTTEQGRALAAAIIAACRLKDQDATASLSAVA